MPVTLTQLVKVRSLFVDEILTYLDDRVAEASKVPPYYPNEARLKRVRIRVRVSSERQKFDPARAAEQERARRMGLADDETLSRAYAHRLSRDGAREDERDERGKRSEVKILDWDKEVRDKVQRGVIVGDPGLGKTWLLKWEEAELAEEAAKQLRECRDLRDIAIPIYRRLSDVADALHTLNKRHRQSPQDNSVPDLADAIVESLRAYALPKTESLPARRLPIAVLQFLHQRLYSSQCLLLLDALDEVPAQQRDELMVALGDWVGRSEARILLTSRVVGYVPPWRVAENSETEREMEVLPFDDGQIGEFVSAFFASDLAAGGELRDIIRRAPQLRGMAQIPLLLGFLCVLHHDERQKPENLRRDLAQLRRGELYDACLRRLLSGAWRRERPRLDSAVQDGLELLEPLAFHLFAAGKEQFSRRDLREATRRVYQALYPTAPLTDDRVTGLVDKWSETDGLLIQDGAGDNAPFRFLHLTFQEYLSACAIAESARKAGWPAIAKLVDKKSWDPRWQEVIILLAGKLAGSLDDPQTQQLDALEAMLELLADAKKDDYFRHRLALAAHCLAEIPQFMQAT